MSQFVKEDAVGGGRDDRAPHDAANGWGGKADAETQLDRKRKTPSRAAGLGVLTEQLESAAMSNNAFHAAQSAGKEGQTGQTHAQQRESGAAIRDGVVSNCRSAAQVNQLVLGRA